MSASFRAALVRLLDAFDRLGEAHEEVYDTEVREQTFDAVYRGFLLGTDADLPSSFGMFSDEGDAAVRAALADFLADPATRAMTEETTPQQRLDAFQAPGVLSSAGMSGDEYFGYVDQPLD